MKKGVVFPALVLGGILAFCLWNKAAMAADVARWQGQLDRAAAYAALDDWDGVRSAVQAGYRDWSARQTYLRVVTGHGTVDEAEASYRRCMAFAAEEEASEFQAEAAALGELLQRLAEMEQFRVGNVL